MIRVEVLRPLVNGWIAEHENAEVAYSILGLATGLTAGAWRKRLCETVTEGPRGTTRGWWSLEAVDEADADELLTAMGQPDLLAELVQAVAGEHISARVRIPGERGRIKRLSKASLLTREQIFAVHKLHIDGGLSMREISRRGYRQWGYSSANSCLNSLLDLLDGYGLERRDRIVASVKASTTHGLRPRSGRKPGYLEIRRARRHEREGSRPPCAGVRLNYPGKGTPCGLLAMVGSEFCVAHDPTRETARLEHLARIRAVA